MQAMFIGSGLQDREVVGRSPRPPLLRLFPVCGLPLGLTEHQHVIDKVDARQPLDLYIAPCSASDPGRSVLGGGTPLA